MEVGEENGLSSVRDFCLDQSERANWKHDSFSNFSAFYMLALFGH